MLRASLAPLAPTDEQRHHFERATVVAPDGRPTGVYRRRDNLDRMIGALGGERVAALRALQLASEAAERGLTPRCALDRSPASGFDGFLFVISRRIEATALADALWSAVPDSARRDCEAVVLRGLSIRQRIAELGGRAEWQHACIRQRLAQAADAVGAALDERFGRARMRSDRNG